MQLALDDSVKLIVSMMSILNPIGVIPIFLSMTESFPEKKVRAIATSCALTVTITGVPNMENMLMIASAQPLMYGQNLEWTPTEANDEGGNGRPEGGEI